MILCSTLFFTSRTSYGANGVTVTQVTATTFYQTNATWFDGYNPTVTANFVYNESNEATDIAGEFISQFILDKGVISIDISTLASTSIDFVIEGRNKNGEWDVLVSKTYTVAEVESFPIVNYYYGLRCGLKVTGAGADVVSVTSDFMTIKRGQI